MVILMDLSGDQAMSSSSPVNLSGQLGQSASPSPFQTQASVEGEEHEDEQSKSSNQTIVTMQQASQQQATGERNAAGDEQQQQQREQRMILSGGSSFEEHEDEKRLMMSVDGDEQVERTKGVSLKLEQDELEARLNQAKSNRFNVGQRHHQQGQQNVESSLVAQMRDIVEGNQSGAGGSSSSARRTTTTGQQQQQRRLEDTENKPEGKQASGDQIKGQVKSSSDSLNNQNDNGHSRGSMDSASQKRTRHSNRAHRRHHGHHHHPHHHHHHHHNAHHHHHPHRQSISGSSLPGQVEGGASTEPAELLAGKSTAVHPHHHSHHHHHHLPHHHHHHHHHGHRHRHSNAGHRQAHHHQHQHGHHAHHHHHHHHQQDQSKRTVSERNSIQRLSLAMIESEKSEGQPRAEMTTAVAAGGPVGAKALESNNSSMSSVSCLAQKQPAQNPSQSQPESKSSGSPPSDEQSAAAAGTNSTTNVAASQQDDNAETQMQSSSKGPLDGQHHPNPHHHHHHHPRHHHHVNHHHNCHHRSNKRRLVLDTAGSGDKSNEIDATQQDDMTTPVNEPPSQQTSKREPLKDLSSGINTAAGDGELRGSGDDKTNRHHHHHHHNNNRHHHHHHHCAHRHQTRDNGQTLASEHQTSPSGGGTQQSSPGKSSHQHQYHCVHHRHRHHQHHHCGRQQQQAHKSRQKSVSQTSVAQKGDEIAADGEQEAGEKSKLNETELPRESDELVQASDEVVKMETSPPPPQLLSSADVRRQSAVGVLSRPTGGELATSQPASQSALSTSNNNELDGRETRATELGDVNETTNQVNQEANCAVPRNQENFQSGESGAGNDQRGGHNHHQQQQGANKLSRQMSSQSSRRSQKEEAPGGGGGPDDLNGRNQSEHLRECAERALQPAVIDQRPDEPRQAVESGVLSDRRCRLCWCCCCPCSALSTRDAANRSIEKPKASQGPPSPPVNTNYPSLSNVPLDEIRSWSESFDKLMRCSDGRKVFQDFLRCEYSEENILFWSACEELKKEKDPKNVAAKARDIYEDYISILSSKEVSLDSRVRDIINNNIKKPTSNIFDEAQLQIYTLMHRDSYPRFINSIMYKKLAQILVSNSRKSSS